MFLTCPTLSEQKNIRHGFFTRRGGKSSGWYNALNCGFGSGDNLDIVAENRDIVARALGVRGEQLVSAYQIHSPNVVTLVQPWTRETAQEGDALVTKTPGVALGILTADCVPILFADSEARVIGAAHAGWKGAFTGVVENTLAAMETLGADRSRIHAAIGPAINQSSYEVGPEFKDRLTQQAPEKERFFLPSLKQGHHMFDLKGYVRKQLQQADIGTINTLANDTCSEEDDFFSFRRATLRQEPVYGRQISAIMLA
ncbi:MAG: peptidoglycan editing factor PgeF [Rickettsiales bacterium]|nr:peptidoglycan editing factor PgeF [Rickettsiales bacterium]